MSKVITIKSVPGRLIMMPDRGFMAVPAEGVKVYQDSFYTRALKDGDVVLVPTPNAAPTANVTPPRPAPAVSA